MQQEQSETLESSAQNPRKPKNEVLEWVKAIAIALVLVFLIRWLLFKPFIVDGPSMQPNFHTGERVIVNEILYDIRSPQRGEVIVFHVPSEGRDFIKRVIGVAGDTVKVEGDVVTVNGKLLMRPISKMQLMQSIVSTLCIIIKISLMKSSQMVLYLKDMCSLWGIIARIVRIAE